MNLGRGEDNFGRLVSFSSPAKGRALYAEKSTKLTNPEFKNLDFKGGDMNTSIIKTALGRTIMVQWDETSPRPYSRHNLIQGTQGHAGRIPQPHGHRGRSPKIRSRMGGRRGSGRPSPRNTSIRSSSAWANSPRKWAATAAWISSCSSASSSASAKGEPLDQNVYEGCFWSAVAPLSEKSVAEDGMPQVFPDFTRGNWKTTKPLGIIA